MKGAGQGAPSKAWGGRRGRKCEMGCTPCQGDTRGKSERKCDMDISSAQLGAAQAQQGELIQWGGGGGQQR